MPNTVITTREEPIATVQINRPDVLNALNEEVLDGLVKELTALDDDDAIRCIVLTGNERAFAAGADIKEAFVTATPVSMLRQDLTSRWEAIRRIRTPIIAAVSGYALGGGCELAMICDIIVASETAQFGQPEINLGIIPGAGGTQRLTRTVGKYRANELILTGRRIKADERRREGARPHDRRKAAGRRASRDRGGRPRVELDTRRGTRVRAEGLLPALRHGRQEGRRRRVREQAQGDFQRKMSEARLCRAEQIGQP